MSGGKEPPRLEGFTQRDEETAPDVFESIRSGQVVRSVQPFRRSPACDLSMAGFLTAYEGACVVCEVVRGPRGLQAVRICSGVLLEYCAGEVGQKPYIVGSRAEKAPIQRAPLVASDPG